MSGGHYNYIYSRLECELENEFEDVELNRLLKDFCKLLKSLEWYKSGDIGQEDYYIDKERFKKKWLYANKDSRIAIQAQIQLEQIRKVLDGNISEIEQ